MTRTGHYYDVVKYQGYSGLCLTHTESIESVADDINDIEKRAKEQGYNNDGKWVIVLVEWERIWDDNNVFVSSYEKRTAVALYDNGTVTELQKED